MRIKKMNWLHTYTCAQSLCKHNTDVLHPFNCFIECNMRWKPFMMIYNDKMLLLALTRFLFKHRPITGHIIIIDTANQHTESRLFNAFSMPFQSIAHSMLYIVTLLRFTIHSIRIHSFFLHFENYSEIQRYPNRSIFSGIISADNCYRNFRF